MPSAHDDWLAGLRARNDARLRAALERALQKIADDVWQDLEINDFRAAKD